MPIKITCPHCEHVHRFTRPYPVPGSEVQCGCGRVLVISFPADLMTRLEARGAGLTDPLDPGGASGDGRYEPAPTPALPRRGPPVQPPGSDRNDSSGETR
jgi:hypothetical protein